MRAKDYLLEIRCLAIRVDQKEQEIKMLRELATAVPAQEIKADLVQTSVDGSGFTRMINRAQDLEAELMEDKQRLMDLRHERILQIQQLEPPYCEILFQRYVECESLDSIAWQIGLSYDRVRHLHGEALQTFGDKFLGGDCE